MNQINEHKFSGNFCKELAKIDTLGLFLIQHS